MKTIKLLATVVLAGLCLNSFAQSVTISSDGILSIQPPAILLNVQVPTNCPACAPQTNCVACADVLPVDTNLIGVSQTTGSVTFAWTLPTSPVSNQIVCLNNGNLILLAGTQNTFTAFGLQPSQTVSAYVAAVTFDVFGVFRTTAAQTNSLIAPTNLSILSSTSTSVAVSCQYNGSPVTGFYWQWSTNGVNYFQQGDNLSPYTFINLTRNTRYWFIAYAHNSTSYGPASLAVQGMTTP